MLAYILGITKRDNKRIANRCKNNHKQGQLKGFQIGAKILQVVAEITNWDRDSKPVQNNFMFVFIIFNPKNSLFIYP